MELKIKYQFTYFIKPFIIDEGQYVKYLLKLLNDKQYELEIFDKNKDSGFYKYFLQNVRDYLFPTFNYNKEKVQEFKKLDNSMKSVILSNFHCNIFNYKFDKEIQGKISDSEGIFFNIDKIEIICFDTGICFLLMKTNIENTEKFSDLLDFNYRFKDINSEFSKLKEYNNIKIQTDMFNNMTELSTFVSDIIGKKNNNDIKLKNIDMYNQRFFVYTYTCIDQSDWEKIDETEENFLKLNNVLKSSYNSAFNKENMNLNIQNIDKWENAKIGFTKQSTALMVSNIDIRNYTVLPYKYENEYLYTLIFGLYQRIFLKKLSLECKRKKDIKNMKRNFTGFAKEVWSKEITNSDTGSSFYAGCKKAFELDSLYDETKEKYDIIYKSLNIDKNVYADKVIFALLVISMIMNVINLLALFKLTR